MKPYNKSFTYNWLLTCLFFATTVKILKWPNYTVFPFHGSFRISHYCVLAVYVEFPFFSFLFCLSVFLEVLGILSRKTPGEQKHFNGSFSFCLFLFVRNVLCLLVLFPFLSFTFFFFLFFCFRLTILFPL